MVKKGELERGWKKSRARHPAMRSSLIQVQAAEIFLSWVCSSSSSEMCGMSPAGKVWMGRMAPMQNNAATATKLGHQSA